MQSQSEEAPDLSLVLPGYNEEKRLPAALERLVTFSKDSGLRLEIVVADDGSRDSTPDIARRWASEHNSPAFSVRLVRIAHRGKGAAVRAGMRTVRAPIVGYCDVDLSAGPDAIQKLYDRVQAGVDFALASRGLPDSVLVVRQPWYREAAGKTFNLALRRLAGLDYRDTQCGLKLFRREVAQTVFRYQRIDGFAFDAELVALALRLGFRVEEIPIRWTHVEDSKVSMVRDSLRMGKDVLRIVRRLRQGEVHPPGIPASSAMDTMTAAQDVHWWYLAKRNLVRSILAKEGSTVRLLDVGCGGGAMLAETALFCHPFGVDLSPKALAFARSRSLNGLVQAEGAALPFASGSFGAALALDMVEHHPRPEEVLGEIRRVLEPNGLLVLTVPAFQWMWSYADHLAGHYRRYNRAGLADDLTAAGFLVERITYFHSWLLPVAWTFRKLRSLSGKVETNDDFNLPNAANRVLFALTRLEQRLLARRDLPFGLSLLAIARQPSTEAALARQPASITAARSR